MFAVVAGSQDGEEAGVQPAGRKVEIGCVGHEVRGDRVLDEAAELFDVGLPSRRRGELGPGSKTPLPPSAIRPISSQLPGGNLWTPW